MGNSPNGYLGFGFGAGPAADHEPESVTEDEISEAIEKAEQSLVRDGELVVVRWTSWYGDTGGRVLVAKDYHAVEWAETKRIGLDTLHAFEDTARKRVLEAMAMLEAEHPLVAQYFKAANAEPSWILWTLYG
jgi:hypothetical protein